MDLRYNDIYLKGVAEGKKEAKERWMIKIISTGLKQNWPLEDIASLVESSVEEVKQYIKDNHLDEK
jgi:predicted transposase YdaD